MKKSVIFFLGKSGSGKDTQADILISKSKFTVVNSGANIRSLRDSKVLEHTSHDSDEYREASELLKIIDSGNFVPTLFVVCMWKNQLMKIVSHEDAHSGIVFTGSPRKLAEAMLLHDFFTTWPDAKNNFEIFPLEINISDEEARRRLLSRLQCAKCGKIFSDIPTDAAKKSCDACGGELVRRKDDTDEGIVSRLAEYQEYVVPVLKYFKEQNLLRSVDGEQSVEKVHQDIVRTLGISS